MTGHHSFGAPVRDATLQAIADLLPLLISSEDAAVIAFQRLARDDAFDRSSKSALASIEAEERVHFDLVVGLSRQLPIAANSRASRHAARRFHTAIASPNAASALAVVAAVDAGTCTILSRLLRSGGPIWHVPSIAALLIRIRNDEAGHVAIARRLAMQAASVPPLLARAHHARAELATLIVHFGHGLERLGVDTDRLARDLRCMPAGLLA